MKLEAEVARIQLNNLPPLMAERLLMRHDVASLVAAGSASISEIGQFRFADIRDALATAPLGSFVDLSGAVRSGVSIARSSDALIRVRGQTGKEKILPELSLLDPSQEIRLEGIKRLSERAQPHWPRSLSWRQIASDSPLADSDFSLLLNELQSIAEPVIGEIGQKLESPGFVQPHLGVGLRCCFAKSQNWRSSSAKRVRSKRFFKGVKKMRQQAGCSIQGY